MSHLRGVCEGKGNIPEGSGHVNALTPVSGGTRTRTCCYKVTGKDGKNNKKVKFGGRNTSSGKSKF